MGIERTTFGWDHRCSIGWARHTTNPSPVARSTLSTRTAICVLFTTQLKLHPWKHARHNLIKASLFLTIRQLKHTFGLKAFILIECFTTKANKKSDHPNSNSTMNQSEFKESTYYSRKSFGFASHWLLKKGARIEVSSLNVVTSPWFLKQYFKAISRRETIWFSSVEQLVLSSWIFPPLL